MVKSKDATFDPDAVANRLRPEFDGYEQDKVAVADAGRRCGIRWAADKATYAQLVCIQRNFTINGLSHVLDRIQTLPSGIIGTVEGWLKHDANEFWSVAVPDSDDQARLAAAPRIFVTYFLLGTWEVMNRTFVKLG